MTGSQKTTTKKTTNSVSTGRLFPGVSAPTGSDKFTMIHQGVETNQFSKVTSIGTPIRQDVFTGRSEIVYDSLKVSFSSSLLAHDLRPSTQMFLDALVMKATETSAPSRTVSLSFNDYMALRGLRDRKTARAQAKRDLKTLADARILFEAKKGRRSDEGFITVFDSGVVTASGQIIVTFAQTFFDIVSKSPVMPYAVDLLKINSNKNPFAYGLGRKVLELKNMNVGRVSEDRISVKTLLGAAPGIPSHEEVMKADRALTRRIIEPFERDMNACEDLFTWEYCHAKGGLLTDEDLQSMDYDLFEQLYVQIYWKNYPDQTRRLERTNAARRKKSKQ